MKRMSNTQSALHIVYRHVRPEDVIEGILEKHGTNPFRKNDAISFHSAFSYSNFKKQALEYFSSLSEDQIKAVFEEQKITTHERLRRNVVDSKELSKITGGGLNVFELLLKFGKDVLLEDEADIVCEYNEILKWRQISHLLSEDIFITSFLAHNDNKYSRSRENFSWRCNIKTNNTRINNILKRGLADSHFHLNASHPVFDLNWILMMNHIFDNSIKANIKKELDGYESNLLSAELGSFRATKDNSLFQLAYKAAVIRAILHKWVNNEKIGKNPLIFHANSYRQQQFRKLKCHVRKLVKQTNSKKKESFAKFLEANKTNPYPHNDTNYVDEIKEDILNGGKEIKVEDEAELKSLSKAPSNERLLENAWRYLLEILQADENLKSSFYTEAYDSEISNYISRKKWLDSERVDYALPIFSDDQHFLAGERKLMYDVFKRSFAGNKHDFDERNFELFYLYLLIKVRIRQEMVQVNSRYGFSNFSQYESRKEGMFDNLKQYDRIRHYYAVNNTFMHENIIHLEMRITPSDTAEKLVEKIKKIDRFIRDGEVQSWHKKTCTLATGFPDNLISSKADSRETILNKAFYVLHFPKRIEKSRHNIEPFKHLDLIYRHKDLRETLKKQAKAIVHVRENNYKIASRIKGIDACANEAYARPEVFAPAFRYLSSHVVRRDSIFKSLDSDPPACIKMTYHVGEDFYDVADGLRAIEEAVRFLDLKDGSRIGHGLALGIDAEKWYAQRNYTITLSVQSLIDNLAWMHSRLIKYGMNGFEAFHQKLEREFTRFSSRIFKDNTPKIHHYFDSWKLRGHCPTLIEKTEEKWELKDDALGKSWDSYNHFLFNKSYTGERSDESVKLFNDYHLDEKTKRLGEAMVEYNISHNYIEVIKMLQTKMRTLIASRRIVLETNPSSNVLIGAIDYTDHPIQKFFNIDQSQDRLQNAVTINTDDKGTFNTSCENEFALIARAMELKNNDDGSKMYSETQIYDWLERIRLLGVESVF